MSGGYVRSPLPSSHTRHVPFTHYKRISQLRVTMINASKSYDGSPFVVYSTSNHFNHLATLKPTIEVKFERYLSSIDYNLSFLHGYYMALKQVRKR